MNHENTPSEDDLTPEEKLRMENEITKLKMQAEMGAKFHSDADLPPEIENEFLKNVMMFEEYSKNPKQIKLYDYIGSPEFKKVDGLKKRQLAVELERLFKLMAEHQVELSVSGEYGDKVIYKFITEELFEHMMDDIHIPGMMNCFSYEEFHPDHADDLKRYAKEFFDFLMKRDLEFLEYEAPNELITETGETLDKEQVRELIGNFINAYAAFEKPEFKITDVEFDLDAAEAHVTFESSFVAVLDNGSKVEFAGSGEFGSVHKLGYWYINRIKLVGLN